MLVDGYPELPYVSLQRRVPKGWWDNQERRNFGETVRHEWVTLSTLDIDAGIRHSHSFTSKKTRSPCGPPMPTPCLPAGL
jgi:hypothetical protein